MPDTDGDYLMADTYGEMFADLVDRQARHYERPEIFRILDISRNQFYNVTNPNRTTSGGNPYPFPMEWMVRATREFKDYSLIRTVVRDCGGLFLSPEDIQDLNDVDAQAALDLMKKIVGKARSKRRGF